MKYTKNLLTSAFMLCTLIFSYVGPGTLSANQDKLKLTEQHQMHLLELKPLPTKQNVPLTLKKKQVTIVTFFASWCPPCLDEFYALNAIQKKLGSDIKIIAVNAFEAYDDNDAARMQRFLTETNPGFALVKGTKQTLAMFGNVNRIPTLYAFDQRGNLAFNFIHARGASKDKRSVNAKQLLTAIEPLLQ